MSSQKWYRFREEGESKREGEYWREKNDNMIIRSTCVGKIKATKRISEREVKED